MRQLSGPMIIDLPPSHYSVQQMTKAQLWARLIWVILAALDYGFGVSETIFVFRKHLSDCFGNVLESVLENVSEIILPTRLVRHAAIGG